MISFLEKFVRRSRKEELGIFWLFWIYFLTLNPVPRPGGPPNISYFLILIGMIAAGFAVWKILQKAKLSAVKDTVIGIEGFLILLFGSSVAALVLMALFSTVFGDVPQLVRIISGSLILVIIAPLSFLAGCLLGATIVKPQLLAIIWVALLGLLFWHFSIWVLLLLIPSIVGTYIGTSRLSYRS